MALTATELTKIRNTVGDACNELTDPQIQTEYDLAFVDAPDTSLIWPYTYVYCLRLLWGIQRTKANRTNEYGDNQQLNQIFDQTQTLLDYWEGVAGLSGGGILSAGVIDLGLDADE